MSGASKLDENPDADPYLERLKQIRRERKEGPRALLLRPGEGLQWCERKAPELVRHCRFIWPLGGPP